ncbi:hypothetical protein [Microvirga terricola]|uniref:Uncharacterized protein n=1 Tax=Microvirga terricola TaxID=2719797 RepID=A0ABX0V8T7_9HYPH|nr:hypothetical protein [Microvirga terricola]NIX75411.1 hypothetical protein [Microvirga terricola]
MTVRLPQGVKATITIYLIGADGEGISLAISNLPVVPDMDRGELSPADLIRALKPASKEVFEFVGDWRFMTDAEIADYQREQEEGEF